MTLKSPNQLDTNLKPLVDFLHQEGGSDGKGVSDQQIDGTVAQPAAAKPVEVKKDGKVQSSEAVAYVLKNFQQYSAEQKTKATDHLKKMGIDVSWIGPDGQIKPEFAQKFRERLLGNGPQGLKAQAAQLKIPPTDPKYAEQLVNLASRNTTLGLLSPADQLAVLRQFDPNLKIDASLFSKSTGMSLSQKVAHYSVLEAKDLETQADSLIQGGKSQEASDLLQRARNLYEAAVSTDYYNPAARMGLALFLIGENKLPEASGQLAAAVKASDPEGVQEILDFLKTQTDPKLFGSPGNAYSFVAEALIEVHRFDEAKGVFKQGAEQAESPELKKQLTHRFHILDEIRKPYTSGFNETSNPLAFQLYRALKEAGVNSAELLGKAGKPDSPVERQIGESELFNFVGKNLQDPRVQTALKAEAIKISKALEKDIQAKGFSKAMADYHAGEAAKLKLQAGKEKNAGQIESHLKAASYFEPGNVQRALALGDHCLASENYPEAIKAFEAAQRLAPMSRETLISLGKAHLGAGNAKQAQECFKDYLAQAGLIPPEKLGEVLDLQKKAGSQLLPQLLKQFDAAKAGGVRVDIEKLALELENCIYSSSKEQVEILKRLKAYHQGIAEWPDRSMTDKERAQSSIKNIDAQLAKLSNELREGLKVPDKAQPTPQQLEDAALLIELDKLTGKEPSQIRQDLKTWTALVDRSSREALGDAPRVDNYGKIFQELAKINKSDTKDPDGAAHQMEDLIHKMQGPARMFIKTKDADGQIETLLRSTIKQVYQGTDPANLHLDWISAEGLKNYTGAIAAAQQALDKAKTLSDVREKRGAYAEALRNYAAVEDKEKVQQVIGLMEATMPKDMKDVDRLQIYGLMAATLKGSKLPQADEMRIKGVEIASRFVGSPASGMEGAKQLLLAKAYFDNMGETASSIRATEKLREFQDKTLNYLKNGDPAAGKPPPTDPKERIELARLAVMIDQEQFGAKLNEAGKTVQEIAEGTKNEGYRPNFDNLTSRLEIWRKEVENAKDLPIQDRLAEGAKMGQALARYKSLTIGDKPLLKPEDYQAQADALEKMMGKMFEESLEPDPKATDAQRQMNAKVVADLKARLHSDVADGNLVWLSQLNSAGILKFAETSQQAHVLLADAESKKGLDAVPRYLQAATLFAQIGLKDRLGTALQPVMHQARITEDRTKKAALFFSCAQLYTMVGDKKEAGIALMGISMLDEPGAPLEVRQMAKIATGMRYLNDGETDKAREILSKVASHPLAAELLNGLGKGTRELRANQGIHILQTWLLSRNTEGSPAEQAVREQGIHQILQEAKELLLSGHAKDLRAAVWKACAGKPNLIRHPFDRFLTGGDDSFAGSRLKGDIGDNILSNASDIADPNLSDQEAAQKTLAFATFLIHHPSKPYGLAGQVAGMLYQRDASGKVIYKNPHFGEQARLLIDEEIPTWAKMDAVFTGVKGIACMTPPGVFLSIFLAGSQRESNEATINALITVGSFGIARGVAVAAEAAWVARMATIIESPVIMSATKFGVRTVTEAAAFPLAGALLTTAFTGKIDHWNPHHFKQEFLTMLVTFVLLHGAGVPIHKMQAKTAQSVAEAETALKLARKAGQGVEQAEAALQRAQMVQAAAKGAGWVGRVSAFTGAEYFNEAIGLKDKEKGIPLWLRFVGSAVTDAQMIMGGKLVDGITNCRISRIEQNTAKALQLHSSLPKMRDSFGADKVSIEAIMKPVLAKIQADPKFDVAKFMQDFQTTLKTLEPAIQKLPKEQQAQVRAAMFGEAVEGKLDPKIAQQIVKRLKSGQSEIKATDSGYDLLPGPKAEKAKQKEKQVEAKAQRSADEKAKAKAAGEEALAKGKARAEAKAQRAADKAARAQEFQKLRGELNALYADPRTMRATPDAWNIPKYEAKLAEIRDKFGKDPEYKTEIDRLETFVRELVKMDVARAEAQFQRGGSVTREFKDGKVHYYQNHKYKSGLEARVEVQEHVFLAYDRWAKQKNLGDAQVAARVERDTAREADFAQGLGYRLKVEQRNGAPVVLGIEKFEIKTGKAVESGKPATTEDLAHFEDWHLSRRVEVLPFPAQAGGAEQRLAAARGEPGARLETQEQVPAAPPSGDELPASSRELRGGRAQILGPDGPVLVPLADKNPTILNLGAAQVEISGTAAQGQRLNVREGSVQVQRQGETAWKPVEKDGVELKPGDKLKVGDLEFGWRAPLEVLPGMAKDMEANFAAGQKVVVHRRPDGTVLRMEWVNAKGEKAGDLSPAEAEGFTHWKQQKAQALLPFVTDQKNPETARGALAEWVAENPRQATNPALMEKLQKGQKVFTLRRRGEVILEDAANVNARGDAARETAQALAKELGINKLDPAATEAIAQRARQNPNFDAGAEKVRLTSLLSKLQPTVDQLPEAQRADTKRILFEQVLSGDLTPVRADALERAVEIARGLGIAPEATVAAVINRIGKNPQIAEPLEGSLLLFRSLLESLPAERRSDLGSALLGRILKGEVTPHQLENFQADLAKLDPGERLVVIEGVAKGKLSFEAVSARVSPPTEAQVEALQEHLGRENPAMLKDPKLAETLQSYIKEKGLNEHSTRELLESIQRGEQLLLYQEGKLVAQTRPEIKARIEAAKAIANQVVQASGKKYPLEVAKAFLDWAARNPNATPAELEAKMRLIMRGVDGVKPALAGLKGEALAQTVDGICRQLAEGKMTVGQAYELAERVQLGEVQIRPSAEAEYGYELKQNPKGRAVGQAKLRAMSDVEAKADKIAQAKPAAERIAKQLTPEQIARYEKYLVEKKGYSPEDAKAAAANWAEHIITVARAHQAGRTHIYDTSLPAKPENFHLDKATVDHHGRFANPKNSTEQLIDRMDASLDAVRSDPKTLAEAKQDKAAMAAARQGLEQAGNKNPSEAQVAEIAAALKQMNLKEVTTDNLADGGWSVWIAKNQARVLADPALRQVITEATHFEDFTAFGTTYSENSPGVRLQAALFQKYGEILKANGIIGSDRFSPAQAQEVMGEALRVIDDMVANPANREVAAKEFFTKVEAARKQALESGLMKDASVHEGDTNLSFFDLTKLSEFTVFQQWLALPRVEAVSGQPHTMQVSVIPQKPIAAPDGTQVPRTLQFVAIPDGRSLPSGKNMKDALARVNARELAKAEALGLVPKEGEPVGAGQVKREEFANLWFGKENVILPDPKKSGTLLTPREVSDLMTDRNLKPGEAPLEMFKRPPDSGSAPAPQPSPVGPGGGEPGALAALPKISPKIPPPVPQTREGSPAGILIGGSLASGNGQLIPLNGKVVGFGEGLELRYSPEAKRYEMRDSATPEWKPVEVGQKIISKHRVFILGEVQGSIKGEGQAPLEDLYHQVKYQHATKGAEHHLRDLQKQGRSVSGVDAENLSSFYSRNLEAAVISHDGGNPDRRMGGLYGGTNQVFALVDPATGRIQRFATRTPKPEEGRDTPLWVVEKDSQSGKLQWVNTQDRSQTEPVNDVPAGAVVVPISIERMSGRVSVDKAGLKEKGLSAPALEKMENLNGYIGQVATAGIGAMARYMGGEARLPAPGEESGAEPKKSPPSSGAQALKPDEATLTSASASGVQAKESGVRTRVDYWSEYSRGEAWAKQLKQAVDTGDYLEATGRKISPEEKAEIEVARKVQKAVLAAKGLSDQIKGAEAELRVIPEGAEHTEARGRAERRLNDLRQDFAEQSKIIEAWKQYPAERAKVVTPMTEFALGYEERATQRAGHEKGFLPHEPKGTPILDVSYRQPHFAADYATGPGSKPGEYTVVLHVRNAADQRAVLGEARLNHGANQAEFAKDPDGKVRSVKLTTPDGRTFSVRVEIAPLERQTSTVDRRGIATGSHEGANYKDHNEDGALVLGMKDGTVTLVVDGVGGSEGGKEAKNIAISAFNQAVRKGQTAEQALHAANQAIVNYNEALVAERVRQGMNAYDARQNLPGAVALSVEVKPSGQGKYSAQFRGVGDCEAIVIRFDAKGEPQVVFRTEKKNDTEVMQARMNPYSNYVDQAMGGHYKEGKTSLQVVSKEAKDLHGGDIILTGSDGFFENFGTHGEIAKILQASGAKTPSEIRNVLMREALIRQRLLDMQGGYAKPPIELNHERYAQAYRDVTGNPPPKDWKGMHEGRWLDGNGYVGAQQALGHTQVGRSMGEGIVRDLAVTRFKQDNATLAVQQIGVPITQDVATPALAGKPPDIQKSRFMHGQRQAGQEMVGKFGPEVSRRLGAEKGQQFVMELGKLLSEDAAGVPIGKDNRKAESAFIVGRQKRIESLAKKYSLEENREFLDAAEKLLVDDVLAKGPRVEPPPKVVPPVEAKRADLAKEVFDIDVGRKIKQQKEASKAEPELDAASMEATAKLMEQATAAFDAAIKEGKTPEAARELALKTVGLMEQAAAAPPTGLQDSTSAAKKGSTDEGTKKTRADTPTSRDAEDQLPATRREGAATFETRLDQYNGELKGYDEAASLQRQGKELTPAQKQLIEDPALRAKNEERARFVRENFRSHKLETANTPDSPTRKHLDAHLTQLDLGSHFETGPTQAFADSAALIQFAEAQLVRAYRGDITPGTEIPVIVKGADGKDVKGRLSFLAPGEVVDGVDVGASGPGGRVVMRIVFDRPIGKEGVAAIPEGQQAFSAERNSGGRAEKVQVIDGEKPDTNVMYIVGGPYGPTGKMGLFTVFSGRYSPPMTHTEYWGRHAFLTGDKSIGMRDGKPVIQSGSNLEKMQAEGRVKLEGMATTDRRDAISPPPPSQPAPSLHFPPPGKLPVRVEEKAKVETQLYEKLMEGVPREARDMYRKQFYVDELESMAEFYKKLGMSELPASLKKDLETAYQSNPGTPEFEAACGRLAEVLKLRRQDARFNKAPSLDWFDGGTFKDFTQAIAKVYGNQEALPSLPPPTSGAPPSDQRGPGSSRRAGAGDEMDWGDVLPASRPQNDSQRLAASRSNPAEARTDAVVPPPTGQEPPPSGSVILNAHKARMNVKPEMVLSGKAKDAIGKWASEHPEEYAAFARGEGILTVREDGKVFREKSLTAVEDRVQATVKAVRDQATAWGIANGPLPALLKAAATRAQMDPEMGQTKQVEQLLKDLLPVVNPSLKNLPEAQANQVREGMFRKILEGKLGEAEARQILEGVAKGELEIRPVEPKASEYGYELGKKKVADSPAPTPLEAFSLEAPPSHMKGYVGTPVSAEVGKQLLGQVPRAEGQTLFETPSSDYHITLLGPADFKILAQQWGLSSAKAQKRLQEMADKGELTPGGRPTVTGIGKATGDKGQTVYFATVEWPEANAMRRKLGLPEKDLHITLASTASETAKTGEATGKPLDVHGVAKSDPSVLRFARPQSPQESAEAAAAQMQRGPGEVSGLSQAYNAVQGMILGILNYIAPGPREGQAYANFESIRQADPQTISERVKVSKTPAERQEILAAILSRPDAAKTLGLLDQIKTEQGTSLLDILIPELPGKSNLKQDPRYYGERTVKDEILHQLREMDAVLPPDGPNLDPAVVRQNRLLRTAALFFAMGKHADAQGPKQGRRNQVAGPDGKQAIRFEGFAKHSAELFEHFIRHQFNPNVPAAERFSDSEILLGRHLVARHMDGIQFLRSKGPIDEKSVQGFVKKIALENKELLHRGIPLDDVVFLTLTSMEMTIRSGAEYADKAALIQRFNDLSLRINNELPAIRRTLAREPFALHPLITGHDINAMVQPGLATQMGKKNLGQLISRISELVIDQQIEGRITTREQALQFADGILKENIKDFSGADPKTMEALVRQVKVPNRLLGIRPAGEPIEYRDRSGQSIARVQFFQADPASQFKGKADPKLLKQSLESGLYPTLQEAMRRQEASGDGITVEMVADALQNKGFRNLAELELFLKEPAPPGLPTPKARLEKLGRTSAPQAPVIEITRADGVVIRIDRGWQPESLKDHLGTGGIHFTAQRAEELRFDPQGKKPSFGRKGETDEQMLARFMMEVSLPVLASREVVEIPSDRDPNCSILIGPGRSAEGGYGAVVVDKSDPKNWKVITTMYQPTASAMRGGHAAYFLRLMFKTQGEGWGKDTPNHPVFKRALEQTNVFLKAQGMDPLTLADVTPPEFQPFREEVVRKAIEQRVGALGLKGEKKVQANQILLDQVKAGSATTEAALQFLESPDFAKQLESHRPAKAPPPAVDMAEVSKWLEAKGFDKKTAGPHLGAIGKKVKAGELSSMEAAKAYVDALPSPAGAPAAKQTTPPPATPGVLRVLAPDSTPSGKIYGIQGPKGEALKVEIPEGYDLSLGDNMLRNNAKPHGPAAAPEAKLQGYLEIMQGKNGEFLSQLAAYQQRTGKPIPMNLFYELVGKGASDIQTVFANAANLKGFSMPVKAQKGHGTVTFTGEILGLGSGSFVYKGTFTDAQGRETPVAIKLPPGHGEIANLARLGNAEIGSAAVYGVAKLNFDANNRPELLPIGDAGPNALVLHYGEGLFVKDLGQVPKKYQDQVYTEMVEDLGKLVQAGYRSFDDRNFMVRNSDAEGRRLQWLDLGGLFWQEPPQNQAEYFARYAQALRAMGVPPKYWPNYLSGVQAAE